MEYRIVIRDAPARVLAPRLDEEEDVGSNLLERHRLYNAVAREVVTIEGEV
jgi:hypothetical protein